DRGSSGGGGRHFADDDGALREHRKQPCQRLGAASWPPSSARRIRDRYQRGGPTDHRNDYRATALGLVADVREQVCPARRVTSLDRSRRSMAQRIADRRHRWTAILVFIAGSPLAAQDIAGENCATPVVGDIGLLQTNTEELASCIAAGPTPGSGVMCDARTRSVVPTTTLYRTCADLEEQRCSLMRAFDDRLRQCAALLASDRGDAAASVLGAADIFMRRMRRFDDARRLVVVPEEFAHRLAE